MRMCLLLFMLYVSADCSDMEPMGGGRAGAAWVIDCCHFSRRGCWMTCGGAGLQLCTMTREVTSLCVSVYVCVCVGVKGRGGGDRTASVWIENAYRSSRSAGSSIPPCSQMKALWTAVCKDGESPHGGRPALVLCQAFHVHPCHLKSFALIIKAH